MYIIYMYTSTTIIVYQCTTSSFDDDFQQMSWHNLNRQLVLAQPQEPQRESCRMVGSLNLMSFQI